MNYWNDLFTGTTWREFRDAGANISGFRRRRQTVANRVQPGDILLCYLTGIRRWVGALEVVGRSNNTSDIWTDDPFDVRFSVRPVVLLDPEHGVPLDSLKGKVDFFRSDADRGGYRGFLRASPNSFSRAEDAVLIIELLQKARESPVSRPYDTRQLMRKPYYIVRKARADNGEERIPVSVPDPDEPAPQSSATEYPEESAPEAPLSITQHTEIQHLLLTLGYELGADVWVARNDRSRTWKGRALGSLPGVVSELPTQFNEVTTRTIELIDVLWLKGRSIIAAFEIECTTSIYSGLLRMSDLLALQPNLEIALYLVAPDERRGKVQQEIMRPTFAASAKPLAQVCGYLAIGKLIDTVEGARKHGPITGLRLDFLHHTAEYFGAD